MRQTQATILSVIARISAALSLVGASYIIFDILSSQTRRSRIKNRLLVGMSVCDFTFCFMGPILGLIMVPQSTGGTGYGTQLTCDIQGFFYSAGDAASAAYNVVLSITYLLIVKYNYSEEKLKRIQPLLHAYPLLATVLISSGFPLKGFNRPPESDVLWCSFLPMESSSCDDDDGGGGGGGVANDNDTSLNTTSTNTTMCSISRRGSETASIDIILFFAAIASICIICICMYLLYRTVLQREISRERFRFQPSSPPPPATTAGVLPTTSSVETESPHQQQTNRPLSEAMRRQGLWYSGAFLLWVLPWIVYKVVVEFINPPIWFKGIVAATLPSMGWLNALVYCRPRFLAYRRAHPESNWIQSFKSTILRQNVPNNLTRGQQRQETPIAAASTSRHYPFPQREQRRGSSILLVSQMKSSARGLWTRVSFLKDPAEEAAGRRTTP